LPINCLCFFTEGEKHLVDLSSGKAGYLALGAKIFLCNLKKMAELRREKSNLKQKKFAVSTFIQSIFINKLITIHWVKTRGEESSAA